MRIDNNSHDEKNDLLYKIFKLNKEIFIKWLDEKNLLDKGIEVIKNKKSRYFVFKVWQEAMINPIEEKNVETLSNMQNTTEEPKMTPVMLYTISKMIKRDTKKAREAIGYSGGFGDGGAGIKEHSLEMYEMGFDKKIPSEWQSYINQNKKENDSEYNEYMRLKNKFED